MDNEGVKIYTHKEPKIKRMSHNVPRVPDVLVPNRAWQKVCCPNTHLSNCKLYDREHVSESSHGLWRNGNPLLYEVLPVTHEFG